MTKETLAALLNGREYGNEITNSEESAAKAAGLVVVFGYSDDNIELRGAIHDEVGCYNGGKFRIDNEGVQPTWDAHEEKARDEAEQYFRRRSKKSVELVAQWRDAGNPCWAYEIGLPHVTFDIMEDGDVFCRGIVFSLEDLK